MDRKLVEKLVTEVVEELERAEAKFPGFNSAHEGWAVLLEEVDELWDAVRLKDGPERDKQLHDEAVQVGAMALRFLLYLQKNKEASEVEKPIIKYGAQKPAKKHSKKKKAQKRSYPISFDGGIGDY